MKFDGIALFDEYNIPYVRQSPKVSPGWVGLRCPRHNGTEPDTLGFNTRAGFFNCWACGSMHPIEFIQLELEVSETEARALYVKFLDTSVDVDYHRDRVVATGHHIELPPAQFTEREFSYLRERNLDQVFAKHDLRGGGFDGDWKFRIVFPITMNGVIVSATGRRIVETLPMKYYTLPPNKELFFHKHTLFNLDNATGSTIAVVEGPIDAVRGGDGFVATCGVKPTEEQILLMTKFDHVVFVKDNDSAGEEANESAMRVAALGCNDVSTVRLDPGQHDVGGMSDDEIRDLRHFLCL